MEIFRHSMINFIPKGDFEFQIVISFMETIVFWGTFKSESCETLEKGLALFFKQSGLKFPSPLLTIKYL